MPVVTIDTLKSWIATIEEAEFYEPDSGLREVVSEMRTIVKAFEEA